jgi:aspartate-semialdehyde dehydrogenase
LAALNDHVRVERLVVSSYQAVSGVGRAGVNELVDQMELATKDKELLTTGLLRDVLAPGEAFSHPIAANFIPQAGSVRKNGYTSEELKLCFETRKIMDLPDLRVTATCVRVPVMIGHGVAVHAEFAATLDPGEAKAILRSAPGVELVDDLEAGAYPTALEAAGRDACYVGRIRRDMWDERALELFCVTDNLRKGAALNTVQIAELLISDARSRQPEEPA